MNNSDKSAFPLPPDRDTEHPFKNGLTKREYFAGLAMQGFCSNPLLCNPHAINSEMNVALNAIKIADELLKQLENGNN